MKKHITHILGLCLCVVVSLGGFLIGGELDSFSAFKALFATNADAAEDTASYYYDGNSVIFSGEGTVKASWFRGNKDIVSVEIPVSVDYIEPYAFSGCTGLKSVRIGTGSGSGIGTTVGSYAFSNCRALESVTVLSANIGDYAFQGCSNLSDITVASCGRIGQGAFYNCSKLSLGIYDIGWVESIGADAFYGTAWYNTQSYWDNGILYYGTYLIKAKTVDGQSGKCTVKDNTVLIADSAFSNSSFASVIVPDSVRSIGNNAFSGINILAYAGNATGSPWGAKKIAKYYDDTFVYSDENKTQLEGCLENKGNIVIPNGVTGIVYRAFSGCTGLTNITIPGSVTSIGNYAFSYCTGLTSITIPDSVTSIGDSAFNGCTGLTSVTIGNGVTNIGAYTFSDCPLENVKMGDGMLEIPSSLIKKDSLKSFIIGYGVTSIGYKSFYGCTGLTSITIPDSVTSIGNYAFCDCTGLTSVTIPDSVISIGYCAFSDCTGLTSVTIPAGVTSIGNYAFSDCTGLTEINYNAANATDLTYSSNMFYNAGTLGEGIGVTFGDSVEKIPAYLFYVYDSSCRPNINSVTIGNSVTSIGNDAFYNCTGLTSVTIPGSVTSIGNYAFSDCTGLTSVTIPDSVTSIGNSTFNGCTGLTSVTIGNSVTSIGEYAFSGCTGLTSVIIPDSVTCIGYRAFYGCTGLKTAGPIGGGYNIEFGWKESIPERAFYECTGLVSITIPDSVTSIGNGAFGGCTGLTSITIPGSVTSIGNYAFSGCTGLTSVTIGNSVTSIGVSAFGGCTGLTDIYYAGSESDRGEILIGYDNEELASATWHYNSSVSDNPDNPLPNIPEANIIKGNSADNQKIYKYKTSVTFTANVPKGGKVQWYVDGKKAGTDSTLTVKDSISSYTVTVVVTDKNGNQTMDEEKVTIKNSFFDKIIWFFKHLFNPGAYDIKQ